MVCRFFLCFGIVVSLAVSLSSLSLHLSVSLRLFCLSFSPVISLVQSEVSLISRRALSLYSVRCAFPLSLLSSLSCLCLSCPVDIRFLTPRDSFVCCFNWFCLCVGGGGYRSNQNVQTVGVCTGCGRRGSSRGACKR